MFDPFIFEMSKGCVLVIFVHDWKMLLLKDIKLCLLDESGDTFEYGRSIQSVNKKMNISCVHAQNNLP